MDPNEECAFLPRRLEAACGIPRRYHTLIASHEFTPPPPREDEFDDDEEWPSNPVYFDGFVHVVREMCETCVLRPGNPMQLAPGRVRGMIEGSIANNSAYACHKTLDGTQQGVCRGYWDRYKDRVSILQIAERLNVVKEIDPDGS